MSKEDNLRALARIRKADRVIGYKTFGEYHGGRYDVNDFVVPWTISAHNYEADLLIMGQDWNSDGNLSGPFNQRQADTGQIAELASNRNLKTLLKDHCALSFCETYSTDAFPFVKMGTMSASIRWKDFICATEKYALPQIEIVRPKVVVALGSVTYNALRKLVGYKYRRISDVWDECSYKGIEIIGVTHTAAMSINMAGGLPGVAHQWELVNRRIRR
jgi:restriction system protein